jgi:proteasome regulatory subunit
MCAKAVASASGAVFIRLASTELIRKYIGEGARLIREIFSYARSKNSSIVFIDEVCRSEFLQA